MGKKLTIQQSETWLDSIKMKGSPCSYAQTERSSLSEMDKFGALYKLSKSKLAMKKLSDRIRPSIELSEIKSPSSKKYDLNIELHNLMKE